MDFCSICQLYVTFTYVLLHFMLIQFLCDLYQLHSPLFNFRSKRAEGSAIERIEGINIYVTARPATLAGMPCWSSRKQTYQRYCNSAEFCSLISVCQRTNSIWRSENREIFCKVGGTFKRSQRTLQNFGRQNSICQRMISLMAFWTS